MYPKFKLFKWDTHLNLHITHSFYNTNFTFLNEDLRESIDVDGDSIPKNNIFVPRHNIHPLLNLIMKRSYAQAQVLTFYDKEAPSTTANLWLTMKYWTTTSPFNLELVRSVSCCAHTKRMKTFTYQSHKQWTTSF